VDSRPIGGYAMLRGAGQWMRQLPAIMSSAAFARSERGRRPT